ncbi:hypothetical protein LSM04_007092 [Trypanosoma melophagium]|uniref:uncharacterized protein n=1 Tax=Trypanosoma melophagium TaxID=715481 RepID=UPI00351A87BD|nr:hypothetical protein LSM04_007092 [Trypanosoma melophagium]
MSFRYTNNLVGALKHRLMLEGSHRDLVRRRFSGHCRGVEVVCSGYGTVLAVRLVDKAAWEPFYRKANTMASVSAMDDETAEKSKTKTEPLDFDKLAESIKTALWDATRKIRAAKEAALHRSLSHNHQLQSQAELKHWYEEDANTLEPLAFEALKHEAATPWMQLVQFGKRQSASVMLHQEFIKEENTSSKGSTSITGRKARIENDDVFGKEGPCVTALNTEDCDPAATPIGSVHPLFVPALIQIEDNTEESVDGDAIRREQWRELSRDEQLFWERVELIRKGQMATIKGGQKRDYADQAAVANDNAEEKVQLRFTQ